MITVYQIEASKNRTHFIYTSDGIFTDRMYDPKAFWDYEEAVADFRELVRHNDDEDFIITLKALPIIEDDVMRFNHEHT